MKRLLHLAPPFDKLFSQLYSKNKEPRPLYTFPCIFESISNVDEFRSIPTEFLPNFHIGYVIPTLLQSYIGSIPIIRLFPLISDEIRTSPSYGLLGRLIKRFSSRELLTRAYITLLGAKISRPSAPNLDQSSYGAASPDMAYVTRRTFTHHVDSHIHVPLTKVTIVTPSPPFPKKISTRGDFFSKCFERLRLLSLVTLKTNIAHYEEVIRICKV
jgi:hypothetical protein